MSACYNLLSSCRWLHMVLSFIQEYVATTKYNLNPLAQPSPLDFLGVDRIDIYNQISYNCLVGKLDIASSIHFNFSKRYDEFNALETGGCRGGDCDVVHVRPEFRIQLHAVSSHPWPWRHVAPCTLS